MNKLFPLLILLTFGLTNCSDDEEPPPTGPGTTVSPRVVVNTTAAEPAFVSTDESVWNNVAVAAIDIATSGIGLPSALTAPAKLTADSVYIQAISANGNLYLKFEWEDASYSVWKDHFFVSDLSGVNVSFTATDENALSNEDQFYMMFDGAPNGWDTWGWRALTTGGGGFAESFTYASNTLIPDDTGTKRVEIALRNQPTFGQPTYAHVDTSKFNGFVLYLDSAVRRDFIIDVVYDPILMDSVNVFWWQTTGWTLDQKVPGWMIERSAAGNNEAELGSRWDVRAISSYDEATSTYTLVLKRKLNTGFSDDLNLALVTDSVKSKIAILNNMTSLLNGGTDRGITPDFWLIF